MKYVAYALGCLQIGLAILALAAYGSRPEMSAMQEASVFTVFGFGTVCVCLGGVIGAIGHQKTTA
jgi:hypothetical protein